MSRNTNVALAAGVAALVGAGIVLAQDAETKRDKPLIASSGLQKQCEDAIRTKAYLKDLKVTFKEEGSGKVIAEGTVPTKVHACALFLTCMSIHGVGQVDISKLRIEHWGSETTPAEKPAAKAGTDVQGGLDRKIAAPKLGMYAVILDPDEKGVTTTPAGARTVVQNDVIVIGDVPASALPQPKGAPRDREYPSGNPGNGDPNHGTQAPSGDQPVAPHNPGAYPDNPK